MALEIIFVLSALASCGLLFLVLFEPGLTYHVEMPVTPPDASELLRILGAITDSEVHATQAIEVLTDGESFYESELDAIRTATQSVHIEAFIFHPSEIADRFLTTLTERAQAGVAVRVIVDAIGSFSTPDRYFAPLRAAGGHVSWYQPIRWYTLKRFNNRTHREIIVVDGTIGFVGGAGIASHWFGPKQGEKPWRDTMLRITGNLVGGLQTAFAENWLESTSQILADASVFPKVPRAATEKAGLVVIGTPSPARSSPARVLFQVVLASAHQSIDINSPYFLPDSSARRELIAAAGRGVRVRIITPGSASNHPIARRASRRRYGELLKAGVEIYEFQPRMIHAKILVTDRLWSVVGSTNFDSRSFDLNDEVNVVVMDRELATRLNVDFERDRVVSRLVTYTEWKTRPFGERALALLGLFLERQE